MMRAALAGRNVRVGEGMAGWVAANRRTSVNADPALDFGDLASRLGVRSCLSTPVFALGHLAGVLSVYSPAAGGFSAFAISRHGTPIPN